jgi:formylmethanofuran dehydrogenase subunit C
MSLLFQCRKVTAIPLNGSVLRPETFLGRSADQASRIRLAMGNTTAELGELFRGRGTQGDERLTIEGEMVHVYSHGREKSLGNLVIRGDVGPQLGAEMTGGTIEVEGSVGDWAAGEMRGGLISIRGNTGSFLGAAYPGSRVGMRRGVILIEGSVGENAGLQMRRGLIAIGGVPVRGSAGP